MNYFITIYKSDFTQIGDSGTSVRMQFMTSSFTLKRKAQEMDEFTVSCREIENSRNAVYVGLHEQNGNLIYMARIGVPKTSDGITELTCSDIRTVLKQKIYATASSLNKTYTLATWMEFLLQLPLTLLTASDSHDYPTSNSDIYSTDVTAIEDSGKTFDTVLVPPKDAQVIDVWDTLNQYCRYYGLVVAVVPMVNTTTGKYYIVFKALNVGLMKETKLSDINFTMTYTPAKVNMVREYYNGVLIDNGYLLLTNNDIIDVGFVNAVYSDSDGFGKYNGKCQYSGKSKSDYLAVPIICKDFMTVSDETDATKISDAKKKLVSEAVEELAKARYQDMVSIELNSAYSIATFSEIYVDSEGKTDLVNALTYACKFWGYNGADTASYSFKILPVSSVTMKNDSKTMKKSVEFGYLSSYWFLRND